MNLYEVIEGKKGEQLTSAVLRFVLHRSQDIREVFIDAVSSGSSTGPIVMRDEFSCVIEQGTTGLEEDSIERKIQTGRIDLIVRTDNSIIGIENKLDAAFTDGQPDKYMATLRAQSVAQKKKRCVLCMLAPRNRKDEIKGKIDRSQYKDQYVLLSWEDLLESIRLAKEIQGPQVGWAITYGCHDIVLTRLGIC
ncbi:MAG: PD-(D/E)XK nuclease family protein [Nitrospiraceae bacterium]